MRICPACHDRYDDASRFCPRDGAALPLDEADARIGTTLLGQFEILEVCGKGAMGTVYRAWQLGMERHVAIKILRPELLADPKVVARFDREARAVAKLSHPNIVTFFLVGHTEDGVPFLAMEYVEGESLAEVVDREGILPVPRVLHIARQITSALSDAHAEGIVHRDLKPANILLTDRRRMPDFVKVLDFGIAKILGGDLDASEDLGSRLTRTGAVFGTPHYIAPEQASGGELDHRADLYSLGVVLYRLLTGRLPFDGAGLDVLLAHIAQPVVKPSEILPGFERPIEALILRALEKDPERRFQSAEEMTDALDAIWAMRSSASRLQPAVIVDDETTPELALVVPSETSLPPAEPPGPRRAVPVAALATVALLAGSAAGTVWLLDRDEDPPAAPAAKVVEEPAPAPEPPPVTRPPDEVRTVTLGEEGYAIRVTVPREPRTKVSYPLVFEVLDPSGRPLAAKFLSASFEEPDGARSVATAPAEEPGRYSLDYTFTRAGRHHVHVFPDSSRKLHMWFDLIVADEDGSIPEPRPGERPATRPPRRASSSAAASAVIDDTLMPGSSPVADNGESKSPPDPYDEGTVDDGQKAAQPPPARPRWRIPRARRPQPRPNPDGLE